MINESLIDWLISICYDEVQSAHLQCLLDATTRGHQMTSWSALSARLSFSQSLTTTLFHLEIKLKLREENQQMLLTNNRDERLVG